jgi:hypothetical protein
MTDRDRQVLKNVVGETRQLSSETINCEFRSAMNCPASTMTVRRELREMGFHGRAVARKPNISPVNAKRLLKWCKERCQWTVENVWFGVMNHAIPCSGPMGRFGCGEYLENDTCQHVQCQQWNLKEVALECGGAFNGMDLALS